MNLKKLNSRPRRIFDMSRVGFLSEFSFEVYIRTNDGGNIPHVHIWDTGTKGKRFNSCVKLTSPEYFPHGGKYKDTFSSKQKDAFVEFMKEVRTFSNKRVPAMTNYEYCCFLWNENNSNVSVEVQYDENDNPIIPDYSQL